MGQLTTRFYLFGFIPLLTPLRMFPSIQGRFTLRAVLTAAYFRDRLAVRFNSAEALKVSGYR